RQELHHDVAPLTGAPGVVDRDDVGVREARDRGRLTEEAREVALALLAVGKEALERDRPVERELEGAVDDGPAPPSAAELGLDSIPGDHFAEVTLGRRDRGLLGQGRERRGLGRALSRGTLVRGRRDVGAARPRLLPLLELRERDLLLPERPRHRLADGVVCRALGELGRRRVALGLLELGLASLLRLVGG